MKLSRKIRATLISPPVPQLNNDRMQPPGGLISIATYCHSQGYDVDVVDLTGNNDEDDVSKNIPESDIYGFTIYTATLSWSVKLVRTLRKRNPNAIFVAGGPHASASPYEIKADFDCVVCGEGEYVFLSILKFVEQGSTQKIPEVIHAEPIENIDQLPFPDFYQFTDANSYNRQILGKPALCIDSSRGCNHKCLFCNSRVVERGHWRARSPENIIKEIEWHMSKGWKAFRFNDDNFLEDPQRTIELCKLMKPLKINYRIFARAESLTEQICRSLFESGCIHVGVGIETASPTMLALMGKATRVANNQLGTHIAHDAGLKIRGFFICGFPGETNATIDESIAGLSKFFLDEAVVYPCIPYPGTDLFTQPDKFGITWIDPDYSKYIQVGKNKMSGFVMKTNTFGIDEMIAWRNRYIETFENLNIAWSDEGEFVK